MVKLGRMAIVSGIVGLALGAYVALSESPAAKTVRRYASNPVEEVGNLMGMQDPSDEQYNDALQELVGEAYQALTSPKAIKSTDYKIGKVNSHHDALEEICEEKDLPLDLAKGVVFVESGGEHTYTKGKNKGKVKRSSAGALGLFQLMPKTAKGLSVNAYHLEENMEGGTRLLRKLWDESADEAEVLAKYNSGSGTVKWAKKKCKSDVFIEEHDAGFRECLPKETREYVPKVLAARKFFNPKN